MDNNEIFFTCDTNLDWDTHKQLSLVTFKRFFKVCLLATVLLAIISACAFFLKALSGTICLIMFVFVFVMLFFGYLYSKGSEIQQGRQKVTYGKDVVDRHIVFSNKIYVTSSCDLERSFEYALIERLYETNENYILVMTHNVALVVSKYGLKGSGDVDFKDFIFEKCYELKKRKFIKIDKAKKYYNCLTIVALFLSIVVLMLYFYLKTPENWRELGRNPQYSSSQQPTSENTSNSSK